MQKLTSQQVAQIFSSLAHAKRVDILEKMLRRSPAGMAFGEIVSATRVPASTLSHHLREMEAGGIISRQAKGRSTMFFLNATFLQQALSQLLDKCCTGQNDI